jgi:hypothetical protein
MSQRYAPRIGRRDAMRAVAGLAVVAAASAASLTPARADSETDSEKRKPRYQPDSAEVQTFYRVNRYPER